MERFQSFKDFYPFYLKEHSKRGTRIVHFIGTPLGVLIGVLGIVRGQYLWIPGGIVFAYGVLWLSHLVFQNNKPATLKHPLYSFLSDWRMIFDLLIGRERF